MSQVIVNEGGDGRQVPASGPAIETRLMQAAGGGGRLKVLLVDDEKDVRDVMKESLEEYYEVVTAGNGKEGLELFRGDRSIDVVVTDYSMPEMNGDEMAGLMKKIRRVGIILLTGESDEVFNRLSRNPNIDVVMKKPFGAKELVAAIEDVGRFRQKQ
jgi:CheY-like chemotaxis protein